MSKTVVISLGIITSLLVTINAEECNCPMSKDYTDVCGSDGMSYTSEEELECLNSCRGTDVEVASLGQCHCPCALNLDMNRLCASNGRSYSSMGELRCYNECYSQKIYSVSHGFCKAPKKGKKDKSKKG